MLPYLMSPLGISQKQPLTLTAIQNSVVTLTMVGTVSLPSLYYCTSLNPGWQTYIIGTSISLPAGQNVQFWNKADTFSSSDANYLQFSMSGKLAAYGNIMSLLNFSSILPRYCFNFLFYNCSSLISAPELPAPVLSRQCYWNMFRDSSITQINIQATDISGVYSMGYMLAGCPVTKIQVSFTQWIDTNGQFVYWVVGVPSSGTFIKPYALAEQYGVRRIPEGWSIVNK